MKTAIFSLLTAAGLWFLPVTAQADPFVYRPHYIHERQSIPDRVPDYDTYYYRKHGRLPPYSQSYVVPVVPAYRWNDLYVPYYVR